MEEDDAHEMEKLMKEIGPIFDRLHSTTSDDSKKQEIINLILLKMEEKTLDHLDTATYIQDFIIADLNRFPINRVNLFSFFANKMRKI